MMQLETQAGYFCTQEDVQIEQLVAELEAKLGVKLMARKIGDTVQGYVTCRTLSPGTVCPLCKDVVGQGAHTQVEVHFYQEQVDADFSPENRHGSVANIRKHRPTDKEWGQVAQAIVAVRGKQKYSRSTDEKR